MADAPLDPEEAARLLLERTGDSPFVRETIALGLRAKAAAMRAEVERLQRDAGRLEALAGRVAMGAVKPRLRGTPGESTVHSVDTLTAEHRVAISAGTESETDDFRRCIREAGYSQNLLAERLDVSNSLVSKWRRPLKKGGRRIPEKMAKTIEKLTGWPADDAHWPPGISRT